MCPEQPPIFQGSSKSFYVSAPSPVPQEVERERLVGKVGLEWRVAKVQTGELGSRVPGWAAQPSALSPLACRPTCLQILHHRAFLPLIWLILYKNGNYELYCYFLKSHPPENLPGKVNGELRKVWVIPNEIYYE